MSHPITSAPLSATEALLRRGFKSVNRFMLLLWRLGFGSWLNAAPGILGRYMVIIHTGRKSGRTYRTPVNYIELDGDLYCTAGFGAVSDWYRNLIANPAGEVWLPNGWYAVKAEDVSAADNALWIMRQVLIASAFAARAAGIDPQRMSDAALQQATRDYRLLRLTRGSARTGPGGPGDLAWVWPATVMAGLLLWLVQRGGQLRRR